MTAPGKVLVTGASGFIGEAVVNKLAQDGWDVRASTRSPARFSPKVEGVIADVGPDTDWSDALAGVDVVVHCAARVHVINESAADPRTEFQRVNTAGTLNLARQAARMGTRRFVFLSSIRVNGAETFGAPVRPDDQARPDSAYAVSKYDAENGLRQVSRETSLEVVIIRPPLVFGPGAGGNFERVLKAVDKRIPLPFGSIRNRRSFVGLDNLVDLIALCLTHPAAAGQVFLVSDGEDLSTTDLFRRVAAAMERHIILLPVPARLLRFATVVSGRAELGQRLCGSLQVDISQTMDRLGWTPRVTVDAELRQTVSRYLLQKKNGVADR